MSAPGICHLLRRRHDRAFASACYVARLLPLLLVLNRLLRACGLLQALLHLLLLRLLRSGLRACSACCRIFEAPAGALLGAPCSPPLARLAALCWDLIGAAFGFSALRLSSPGRRRTLRIEENLHTARRERRDASPFEF